MIPNSEIGRFLIVRDNRQIGEILSVDSNTLARSRIQPAVPYANADDNRSDESNGQWQLVRAMHRSPRCQQRLSGIVRHVMLRNRFITKPAITNANPPSNSQAYTGNRLGSNPGGSGNPNADKVNS